MKIFDKFKNLFTEEVEEDIDIEIKEPVKEQKEVPKEPVKIETPIATKIEEDSIKSENTNLKKEEKFVFPVYFDDKDFDDLEPKIEEKPKKIEQPKHEEKKEVIKEPYSKKPSKEEEKRNFRPTPIISPVYGILDKNYYKEDIVVSPISRSEYRESNKNMTIDDVRKKAFGTLEDDLEKTLFSGEPFSEEAKHGKDDEISDDDSIFNEFDFANAVEEDKRRDLSKDGLKADIESLLKDEDFSHDFDYHVSKKEEDMTDNDDASIEDEILNENNYDENIQDNVVEDMEDEIIGGDLSDTDEVIINNFNDEDLDEEMETEEISKNLEKEDSVEEEITSKDEKDIDDLNVSDEVDDITDGELEMPDNTSDDSEIENAFADSSDLNDSDLFNLIDSMYDKEEE